MKSRGLWHQLLTEILTDTKLSVRLTGALSEESEIKTIVKRGHGLSLIVFNIALDKVIRQWKATNDEIGYQRHTWVTRTIPGDSGTA